MTDAWFWNVHLLSIKEGGWFKAIQLIMLFFALNANDTDVHNEKKTRCTDFEPNFKSVFNRCKWCFVCHFSIKYWIFKRQLSKYEQSHRHVLSVYKAVVVLLFKVHNGHKPVGHK